MAVTLAMNYWRWRHKQGIFNKKVYFVMSQNEWISFLRLMIIEAKLNDLIKGSKKFKLCSCFRVGLCSACIL